MKKLVIYFLLSTATLYAQNKVELLLLQHDGKINLVPKYGGNDIEKTSELKEFDKKFITDAINQFGSSDSACKVYNALGWDFFYRGDIKTSMKRFNQAWLLDTNNASEYFGFSAILEVIKDHPDNYFETWLLKIKSVDDPKINYKIGVQKDKRNEWEIFSLYFTSTGFETYGNTDMALSASNRLLELLPQDTFALQQRGHLYIVKKEWEKAIVDLNQSYQNGSKDSKLFNDLGYSYQENGDYENAFMFYEKSSKANSSFINPFYNNALLRLKVGQFDIALEYIEKCISIKDDHGPFYKTKGEILLKLNKKEEGIQFLKKAKKLGDKDAAHLIKENK